MPAAAHSRNAASRPTPAAVGFGSCARRRLLRAVAAAVFGAGCARVLPGFDAAAAEARRRLLALGDSLTAGYGLPREQAFPARLEAALRGRGLDIEVVDAGVSGDTTAGGLARLDWMLSPLPDAVIVELGANDGLRGLDPRMTYANLDAILARLAARQVRVLLAGMLAPPNLGREYGAEFNAVFPRLAARHDVALYPFFLDGVAADPALNQADGIHPNAKGVEAIVARILPAVLELFGA